MEAKILMERSEARISREIEGIRERQVDKQIQRAIGLEASAQKLLTDAKAARVLAKNLAGCSDEQIVHEFTNWSGQKDW